jgi:hypothetical protein
MLLFYISRPILLRTLTYTFYFSLTGFIRRKREICTACVCVCVYIYIYMNGIEF